VIRRYTSKRFELLNPSLIVKPKENIFVKPSFDNSIKPENVEPENVYNQKEQVKTIIPTEKENKPWEKQVITYNSDGTVKTKKWKFKNVDKAIEWIKSW